MRTLPHIRTTARSINTLRAWHNSARARALTAWHRRLPAAEFGLLIAAHPKWPLIDGHAKHLAAVVPLRPAPGCAA